VGLSFRQRPFFTCLLAATLLIGSGFLWAQTPRQKRKVIDKTTSTASSVQKAGSPFALVVGINDYQHLPHLLTPVNDAKEIASVLSDQYGFRTQLLLDATRDQIVGALDGYRRALTEADSLLIYYAGHGYFDKDVDQAYWAPVDAGEDTYARWIIATEITGTAKAVPARHVLVISDSCYSGMLAREASLSIPSNDRANFLEKMLQTKSRHVMSSGGNEPVADSDAKDHFSSHSVFANALLQGLSQFPTNEFTAQELFTQIKEQVGGRSKQVPQYNPIRDSLHEGGDFVFVRVRSAGVSEGTAIIHSNVKEPPAPPTNQDEEAVRTALNDYEDAYASMDVRELRKVWPSMSRGQEREIKNGFEAPGLRAVKVQLRNRTTTIAGGTATVNCDQWMVYTFAGRRQPPQINSVVILLAKNAQGNWVVNEVKGR
jgi:hypothetical protein